MSRVDSSRPFHGRMLIGGELVESYAGRSLKSINPADESHIGGRLLFRNFVGDLATLKFNLAGTNAEKNMRLTETASGTAKNGAIDLARLDAGSFSEGPKPPLKVSGTISGDKLSLNFEPLPTNIRDGFAVRGKLEANAGK